MSKIVTTAALILLAASVSAAEKTKTHFQKAVELYTKGPSKADEILRELDLELKERPSNSGAYVLKALTLMGTKRCPEALMVVRQLEEVPSLKGKVFPAALEVRARCLCEFGKFAEAKAALEPYKEHFQQKEEWRKSYATLMQGIEKLLRMEAAGR